MTQGDLVHWFTYHAPTPPQCVSYERIRAAALSFATVVLAETPTSADQTVAIRKIREAVMVANSSIACRGQSPPDSPPDSSRPLIDEILTAHCGNT